jgi:hypothetical protein
MEHVREFSLFDAGFPPAGGVGDAQQQAEKQNPSQVLQFRVFVARRDYDT